MDGECGHIYAPWRISRAFGESTKRGAERINDVLFLLFGRPRLEAMRKSVDMIGRRDREDDYIALHDLNDGLPPEEAVRYLRQRCRYDSDSAKDWNPLYRIIGRREISRKT